MAQEQIRYDLEGHGPYDEDELRAKLRDYVKEHGTEATLKLAVIELPKQGGTMGRRLDVGQFLD
jgi:hypothetical protein